MQRLQPENFRYGNYGLVNLPFDTIKTTESYFKYILTLNIVGYCDGADTEIRPRPDDMAVMIDDDGFQTWIHIPKDVWKEYMKSLPEN